MRTLAPIALVMALTLAPAHALAQEGTSQADPRNFSWVEEGVLAIGGGGLTVGQVDWLHSQGFRAIGDFRAEHRDPSEHIRGKGMAFLDIPVHHAVDLNVTQLRTFLGWAKEQEAQGRPMYVHCTNGWHRAAAFVVAWEMERRGWSYDEAMQQAIERRPGTVGRAPGPLLALEAQLTDKPGATVMLVSGLARPEPGGTMPVTVEVRAAGAPAAGASVRVWSEESGMRLKGTTDAEGRFTFTYKAPRNQSMDHLYARASVPGFVDGADQVELFYFQPAHERGPVDVRVNETYKGLHVRVTHDGQRVPARIVASTPSGWSAFDSSSRGEVTLPRPPLDEVVTVRAESWGALPGTGTLDLRPPPPEPTPAAPTPEPTPEPTPAPTPEATPTPPPEPTPTPTPPATPTIPLVAPTPEPTPQPKPDPTPAAPVAPSVEPHAKAIPAPAWVALGGALVALAFRSVHKGRP